MLAEQGVPTTTTVRLLLQLYNFVNSTDIPTALQQHQLVQAACLFKQDQLLHYLAARC
jgi:hypothetical protein